MPLAEPHTERRLVSRGERPGAGWGSQALWEAMRPWWPDLAIEVVERVGSTNVELVERLRQAARNAGVRGTRADDLRATLLVAEQQTQGRGRLGRSWLASPGASLTFSFAVPMQRQDWSGLSLAVGVAVARALDPAGQHLRLKWPNDLWLPGGPAGGRKLGGVLIESITVGEQRVAVVGVGLNVLPQTPLPDTASISEFLPQALPASVLAQVGPSLARALADFEHDGFAAFGDEFAALDLLAGQPVTTTDARCPAGVALGVAGDGALRVLYAGVEHRIVSGEVSVRPAAPGSAAG